jgi:hypothetical protein
MTLRRPRSEDELVDLVRSIDIEAPPALRARVEEMIAATPSRRRRTARGAASWRARPLAGALATAALLAALVAVLATSGGGSGHGLGLRSAAAPTLLTATAPAPAQSARSHFLTAAVEGVRFPYWGDRFGWHSSGARSDTVAGRAVTTVFYTRAGARIGYAIYGGVPAPRSSGGAVATHEGTQYHVLSSGGTSIISWKRGGHLCVMSSRGASAAELIRLAGWDGGSAA